MHSNVDYKMEFYFSGMKDGDSHRFIALVPHTGVLLLRSKCFESTVRRGHVLSTAHRGQRCLQIVKENHPQPTLFSNYNKTLALIICSSLCKSICVCVQFLLLRLFASLSFQAAKVIISNYVLLYFVTFNYPTLEDVGIWCYKTIMDRRH